MTSRCLNTVMIIENVGEELKFVSNLEGQKIRKTEIVASDMIALDKRKAYES